MKQNTSNSKIQIKDLVVDYGEAIAVNKVNLEINKGELVTLLGPSGCGKSTTLNALAGLITTTSGKIYFDGENVTKLSPRERQIGLVFQSYALYPHMTVYKNIAFPLESNDNFRNEVLSHNEMIENKINRIKFVAAGGSEEEFDSLLLTITEFNERENELDDQSKLVKFKAKNAINNSKDAISLSKLHKDASIKTLVENLLKNLDKGKNKVKEAKKDIKFITSNSVTDELTEEETNLINKLNDFIIETKEMERTLINQYKEDVASTKELAIKEKEEAKVEFERVSSEVKDWREKQLEKIDKEIEDLEAEEKISIENEKKIEGKLKQFSKLNNVDKETINKIEELEAEIQVIKIEVDKKVRDIAEIVGITKHINKKISNLSGGQQQRVAISRALVKNPNILLLDEPLSNLDAKMRVSTREWIRSLQQRLNITTIFVTHDQEEAMSISDRVVCMKDGVVQQFDTPMNMYNKPINKFVAGFLGMPSMNFFNEGDIHDEISKKTKAKESTFGCRPEHIKLNSELRTKDKPLLTLKGNITLVEMFGRDKLITVDTNGNKIKMFVHTEDINLGDQVDYSLLKGKVTSFNKDEDEKAEGTF